MNTEERVTLLREMISCQYPIQIRAYDADGNPLAEVSEQAKQCYYLFNISGGPEQMVNYGKRLLEEPSDSLYPLVMSDMLGLMWVSVYLVSEQKVKRIYLFGPAFTSEASVGQLQRLIDKHNFSIPLKRRIMGALNDIAVITSPTLFQYAVMLHYCVTGEKIKNSDLCQEPPGSSSWISNKEDPTQNSGHLGVWQNEQQLMRMIEEGNLNYASTINTSRQISTGVKICVGDPLRQGKDSIITFIAISTRAAIRGGLSPATAYNLNDYYVQSVENCTTLTETAHVGNLMYQEFIQRVHKCKANGRLSPQIRGCCEYIDNHICEKLSLQDISSHLGYTEYYLTRKFKKETGKSINEYITEKKIDYAKILLSTSSQSIQEISDTLNYCSRSYFSNTFQKITGTSPAEYRLQNLRI